MDTRTQKIEIIKAIKNILNVRSIVQRISPRIRRDLYIRAAWIAVQIDER